MSKSYELKDTFEQAKTELLERLDELEGRWREMAQWLWEDGFEDEDYYNTLKSFGLSEDEIEEMMGTDDEDDEEV